MTQRTALCSVQPNAFADDGVQLQCREVLLSFSIMCILRQLLQKYYHELKEQAEDKCRVGRLIVGVM